MLEPNTTYYVQIKPRNSVGVAENCDQIWSFTTMDAISTFPYIADIESVSIPDLPEFWQDNSFSEANWISSDLASHSGNNAMACYNTTGFVKMDYDNWFISPPFSVSAANEYNIRYFYRPLIGGSSESMSLYWGNTPYIEDLTNLLYEDANFNGDWEEASSMLFPEEDGIIFLGIHMNSVLGYGGFVDDVTFDDWGTVSVNNNLDENIRLYSQSNSLIIETSEHMIGADVRVTNTIGQTIYSGKIGSNKTQIPIYSQTGLFIVTMIKDGNIISAKVIH